MVVKITGSHMGAWFQLLNQRLRKKTFNMKRYKLFLEITKNIKG